MLLPVTQAGAPCCRHARSGEEGWPAPQLRPRRRPAERHRVLAELRRCFPLAPVSSCLGCHLVQLLSFWLMEYALVCCADMVYHRP